MKTLPRRRWTAWVLSGLALGMGAVGCAHQREAFYPPGRRAATLEPPLDPATPGATRKAVNEPRAPATAQRGQTKSRQVEDGFEPFDFDAYRE